MRNLVCLALLALALAACAPQTVYIVVTATPPPFASPTGIVTVPVSATPTITVAVRLPAAPVVPPTGTAPATHAAIPTGSPPRPVSTAAPATSPRVSPSALPAARTSPTTTHSAAGCPQGCTEHVGGCDIKGNISLDSKAKIYHVPGGRYYDATVISTEFGERWFCTEAEAKANGWRKSAQ